MTLRARLTLAIVGLVLLASLLASGIASRAILAPFSGAVFRSWVQQAVYVVEQVEAGADPRDLERRLSVDIRPVPGPPPESRRWQEREYEGRQVWYRPGPRDVVAVESAEGWFLIRRDLDLDRPGRRLPIFLLAGMVPLALGASWIASRSLRPVQTAREAMARIAAGDFDHRLDVEGPGELRQMAASFNAMAEEVTRRMRAERELMAGISHDLRTPLTRVRLELELLRDAGAPEARIDAAEHDIEEVERLIAELLELSRLELGQVAVDRRPTDLRALVEEVAADLGQPVELRGEGAAEVDPRLLARAVANLLSNAARHAPGARVTVTVAPGRLVFEDDGPGVSDEELPRLFDPFWRGGTGRRRPEGGLGLGLMIVRQVAGLHGGAVRAERREEGGLRVVLELGAGSVAGT